MQHSVAIKHCSAFFPVVVEFTFSVALSSALLWYFCVVKYSRVSVRSPV